MPEYFYNVIRGKDEPLLVIYRRDNPTDPLKPITEPLPVKNHQIPRLIRDLAEHWK